MDTSKLKLESKDMLHFLKIDELEAKSHKSLVTCEVSNSANKVDPPSLVLNKTSKTLE